MRVLVACEFSGIVRAAFRARGHDAWSSDMEPAEDGSPFHILGDVRPWLKADWDLIIAHPPCTDLAVSGARWFKDKATQQVEALRFVREMMMAPAPRIAVENPASVISSRIRKPDQIFQPYHFGHPEFKATHLWLLGLPPLAHTKVLTPPAKGTKEHKEWSRVHREAPGDERAKNRSRTYQGVAEAMAEQWAA